MKKRFGIDIDGTVTCPSTLVPYLNKAFNVNLTLNDIKKYDLTYAVNIPHIEFANWFRDVEATIYEESPLAYGAKNILNQWKEQYELIFISARPTHLLDVTKNWFTKHDLSYYDIELTGSHDKISAAKKHQVDIFFEDKHDNAVSIHEECNIPVILFDTPYNQDPIPSGVIRVNNWQEANLWVENWIKHS